MTKESHISGKTTSKGRGFNIDDRLRDRITGQMARVGASPFYRNQ